MTKGQAAVARFALMMLGLALVLVVAFGLVERGAWKEREKDLEAQVTATNEHWLPKYTTDSTAWSLVVEELAASNAVLAGDSARLHQQADSLTTVGAQSDSTLAALQATMDMSQLPQEARDLFAATNSALLHVRLSLSTCNNRLGIANNQRDNCRKQLDGARQRVSSLEQLRGRLTAERDSAIALNQPPPFFALSLDVGVGGGCVVGVHGEGVLCGPSVHVTVLKFRIPVF